MNWLIQLFQPPHSLSWLTNFLQTVAWPAAMIGIAAMFRSEVRNVMERLVRLKYQNFEAQFQAELSRSEGLAPCAPALAPTPTRRLIDLPSDARRLVHEVDAPTPSAAPGDTCRRDPRGAIEQAWSQLSAAADRAVGTAGVDPMPALVERGILAGQSLLLFDQLRQLRGQVDIRTDWIPSPADAARFVSLARQLSQRLAQATAEAADRAGERGA